jgi:hypothetical protein
MKFGTAGLPKHYRKEIPSELRQAVESPACVMRPSHLGSRFGVRQSRYVVFFIDIWEGVTGFAHELAHFVTVDENRCGIADFGFIFDKKERKYPPSHLGWPAILHEAEVFARERNLAKELNFSPRATRDELHTLLCLPGATAWLDDEPTLSPEQHTERLISQFLRQERCSAEHTLHEVRRRLALLEAEPQRIRRTRFPKHLI